MLNPYNILEYIKPCDIIPNVPNEYRRVKYK